MNKDNINYGSIVNKMLSWGFAPVFCILGILLMVFHDKIDITETTGVIVIAVGIITYLITFAVDTITNSALKKNKELTAQIKELNQKITDLEAQIDSLKQELSKYKN